MFIYELTIYLQSRFVFPLLFQKNVGNVSLVITVLRSLMPHETCSTSADIQCYGYDNIHEHAPNGSQHSPLWEQIKTLAFNKTSNNKWCGIIINKHTSVQCTLHLKCMRLPSRMTRWMVRHIPRSATHHTTCRRGGGSENEWNACTRVAQKGGRQMELVYASLLPPGRAISGQPSSALWV